MSDAQLLRQAAPNVQAKCEYLCTLEDVARELGISRAGAWYLEASALAKCRKILKRRGLTFAALSPIRADVTEYE